MHEVAAWLVVLTGYTVLGLTGFGSALVIVPLLAWQWPLPEVVALVLVLDLPASLMHSGLNWRQVQWTELRKLLPGMVLQADIRLGSRSVLEYLLTPIYASLAGAFHER